MTHHFQMKNASEIKFPSLTFSPIATSSPRLTKMRKIDRSWTSSNSSDSIGHMCDLLTSVEKSNFKTNHESTSSMHTALEYVNPDAFYRQTHKTWTRHQLRDSIFSYRMAESNNAVEAQFYALVTTERILWDMCATWKGSIRSLDELESWAIFACDDWYMRTSVKWCNEELARMSPVDVYDYQSVSSYLQGLSIPKTVADRVFQPYLVRQSGGDCLETIEVLWLIFATVGMDEKQSFEYWFRVLDVHSEGVLSFSSLRVFYTDVSDYLSAHNVTALPFEDVIEQFVDILATDFWTLTSFKKKPQLAGRVFVAFTNALRFFEQQTDEKTNGEREDDEKFGCGDRNQWQRMLDHTYNYFYAETSSILSSEERN